MRKSAIYLSLLAGIAAAPAYAQDSGVTARIEARVGYDEARAELTVQNGAFQRGFGVGDLAYGAEAGVDAHLGGALLVGAYVGLENSQVDGCQRKPFVTSSANRNDLVCIDADRNFTVGGRVGLKPGDRGLIYLKGGYSRGKFSGSYYFNPSTATNPAPPPVQVGPTFQVFSATDTVPGYHLGAGFELGLSDSIYVKAEYVTTRYRSAFEGSTPFNGNNQFDPSRHQLMGGIGVRFGAR